MSGGEQLNPENISIEAIKAVLESYGIRTKEDSEGDLILQTSPGYMGCALRLRATKTVFRIMTNGRFKSSVPRTQRLTCANNINEQYGMANAYVEGDGLHFCHDVIVSGGITHANMVATIQHFRSFPVKALPEYTDGLLQ